MLGLLFAVSSLPNLYVIGLDELNKFQNATLRIGICVTIQDNESNLIILIAVNMSLKGSHSIKFYRARYFGK